jgi:hypothetical protein
VSLYNRPTVQQQAGKKQHGTGTKQTPRQIEQNIQKQSQKVTAIWLQQRHPWRKTARQQMGLGKLYIQTPVPLTKKKKKTKNCTEILSYPVTAIMKKTNSKFC